MGIRRRVSTLTALLTVVGAALRAAPSALALPAAEFGLVGASPTARRCA